MSSRSNESERGPAAGSESEAPAPSTAASRPTSSGPEYVRDDLGPAPPTEQTAMMETTKAADENGRVGARRPVGVEEIDDDAKAPVHGAVAASSFDRYNVIAPEIKSPMTNVDEGLLVHELVPPGPPKPAAMGEHAGCTFQTINVNENGEYINNGDEEAPVLASMSTEQIIRNGEVAPAQRNDSQNIIPASHAMSTTRLHHLASSGQITETHPVDASVRRPGQITEAYPVDEDVIVATAAEEILPWWKQRRTKLLLAFVFIVVGVLVVALGVILSSSDGKVTQVVVTSAEESTASPSSSVAPTSSRAPSLSPSSCSYTIAANAERLDLLHPDASEPKIAMDGRNLVVVAKVVPESKFLDGSVLIIFYSLTDDGKWEEISESIEGSISWSAIAWGSMSVALSGGTAIVGLPFQKTTIVYEQNSYGRWERTQLQPATVYGECGFGHSVSADRNLMATLDLSACGNTFDSNAVYLFQKFRGNWEEIEEFSKEINRLMEESMGAITANAVSISGNTIGVKMISVYDEGLDYSPCQVYLYMYDQGSGGKISLADKLPAEQCGLVTLVGDHIFLAVVDGVTIFRRQGVDQSFKLHQHLDAAEYGEDFGRRFAIDQDMLVVGSQDSTHIFSQRPDGYWNETLTIDQSYRYYQLSGRALIAANEREVHTMGIADCTQQIPTQMPSVSAAPSTCYEVEFKFSNFEEWEEDWEARLLRIESETFSIWTFSLNIGDWDEVEETVVGTLSYGKSLCLSPGQYELRMDWNSLHGANHMYNDWHYSVKENGKVIAQDWASFERWAEFSKVVPFDLPFDHTSATAPTGRPWTSHPTTSAFLRRPTSRPTVPPPTRLPTPTTSPRPIIFLV